MKKLLALTALILTTTSMAATIKIEATTRDAFGAWFMPTRINSTSTINIGQGYVCTNMVRGEKFQLLCRQHGMIVLLYRDNTPQKDAVLATPKAIVSITTVKEKNTDGK